MPALREQICGVMAIEGIRADPDDVVVTVGSQMALDLVAAGSTVADRSRGADRRVQVLEVNVSPGLTETSLLPTAARASGTDLGTLYAALAS